ncbi:MAG TPA: nucleoside triphosphate pyrophosphohydrolase [Firmicutes bacterium]|nr:nucleoside triphosphate pyrophosphohydrolase [Bacillota bacterium]
MTGNQDRYSLKRLVDIVARLRGEGGCPWDRKQTHESIKPHLIEEAYEVVEAIDTHDMHGLVEELGDVLLHVVFHSQLASEEGRFDVGDVIKAIEDKMIRRHPHVFGDASVSGADEVLRNWERIKQEESSGADGSHDEAPDGILGRLPKSLPALMRAHKAQSMASRVGFDWTRAQDAMQKVSEELKEFRAAMDEGDSASIAEELGDLLFAIVNVARHLGVDPEVSLMNTVDKFVRRFTYIEASASGRGVRLEDMSLDQMDELWDEAKRMER